MKRDWKSIVDVFGQKKEKGKTKKGSLETKEERKGVFCDTEPTSQFFLFRDVLVYFTLSKFRRDHSLLFLCGRQKDSEFCGIQKNFFVKFDFTTHVPPLAVWSGFGCDVIFVFVFVFVFASLASLQVFFFFKNKKKVMDFVVDEASVSTLPSSPLVDWLALTPQTFIPSSFTSNIISSEGASENKNSDERNDCRRLSSRTPHDDPEMESLVQNARNREQLLLPNTQAISPSPSIIRRKCFFIRLRWVKI